jgi:hypothetical protein
MPEGSVELSVGAVAVGGAGPLAPLKRGAPQPHGRDEHSLALWRSTRRQAAARAHEGTARNGALHMDCAASLSTSNTWARPRPKGRALAGGQVTPAVGVAHQVKVNVPLLDGSHDRVERASNGLVDRHHGSATAEGDILPLEIFIDAPVKFWPPFGDGPLTPRWYPDRPRGHETGSRHLTLGDIA